MQLKNGRRAIHSNFIKKLKRDYLDEKLFLNEYIINLMNKNYLKKLNKNRYDYKINKNVISTSWINRR